MSRTLDGGTSDWPLAGRSRSCCWPSYKAQDSPFCHQELPGPHVSVTKDEEPRARKTGWDLAKWPQIQNNQLQAIFKGLRLSLPFPESSVLGKRILWLLWKRWESWSPTAGVEQGPTYRMLGFLMLLKRNPGKLKCVRGGQPRKKILCGSLRGKVMHFCKEDTKWPISTWKNQHD